MDNRPDIWYHLRDHQTPPPPELLPRLYQSLFRLDGKDKTIPDEEGNGALERLQQQQVTPPVFLRESITGIIHKSKPDRFRVIHIAATFLLLLTGFTIYKTLTTGKSNLSAKNNTIIKETPIVSIQTGDTLKSGDTARMATTASSGNLPVAATDSMPTATIAKHDRSWTLRLDGHSIYLVDNDPLFTFTSYHYPDIGNYMEQKTGEEIKIHIDQYTNIVVSKQAAAMIREMYKIRSNGKPTRRARKMKERLEDWKRADEKHFDGAASFNPADPVDLAEFIFK